MEKEKLNKLMDEIMSEDYMMTSATILGQRILKKGQEKSMKTMWDKIVKLLFQMDYKDREINLIVMSCCKTEKKAQKMIDYLEKNIKSGLTRNQIIEMATKIRAEN